VNESDLAGRQVFITGATGFVGANLARRLIASGAEVHALVRGSADRWRIGEIAKQMSLHEGDLLELESLRRVMAVAQPEMIFHLAIEGGHPSESGAKKSMMETSVVGTLNLLEEAEKTSYSSFVHVSSSLVYGRREEPLREDDLLRPVTFRGAAKAGADLLCLQFARERQRPVVILRLFSVYGYWEQPGRLIPTAIEAAHNGTKMSITPRGCKHDLVFVADVVRACLLAGCAPDLGGEVINIGSGVQWDNQDVVRLVEKVTGRAINYGSEPYPLRVVDSSHWVADITKARRLLGWRPTFTLAQGLAKMLEWFENHSKYYEVR